MRSWPLALILSATLGLAACAAVDKQVDQRAWLRKTRDTSVKAVDVVTRRNARAAKRNEDYLARQDTLKGYVDGSPHNEALVIDVLRKAGVSSTPPPPTAAKAPSISVPPPPGAKPPVPPVPSVPPKYLGPLRWPVDAGIVSAEYGGVHRGLDIAADIGESVLAIADGEVIYAGEGLDGYGKVVIVRHDQTLTSLYAHNSELKVDIGEKVRQGEQIALLGSTGRSNGPHVHFEVRDAEKSIDPRTRLRTAGASTGDQIPSH
jgi:murein DD-endopeptidase MepM/ murein hydrolase activator NlpD